MDTDELKLVHCKFDLLKLNGPILNLTCHDLELNWSGTTKGSINMVRLNKGPLEYVIVSNREQVVLASNLNSMSFNLTGIKQIICDSGTRAL